MSFLALVLLEFDFYTYIYIMNDFFNFISFSGRLNFGVGLVSIFISHTETMLGEKDYEQMYCFFKAGQTLSFV